MKNNTYYFDHDYNAQGDHKIESLLYSKGWEGYGIFWAIVEKLAQEPTHKLPKDYDKISFVLRSKNELIKSVIEDYDLFKFDDGFFWSERLIKHFEHRDFLSEKGRAGGLKRVANFNSGFKPKSRGASNWLQAKVKGGLTEASSIKEKEKESKVKESKIKSVNTLSSARTREGEGFTKPSFSQVSEFISKNLFKVNPEEFYNFYESKGWMVGKSPMVSWESKLREWSISRSAKKERLSKTERVANAIETEVQEIKDLKAGKIDKLTNQEFFDDFDKIYNEILNEEKK